jgi:hypothetical protein
VVLAFVLGYVNFMYRPRKKEIESKNDYIFVQNTTNDIDTPQGNNPTAYHETVGGLGLASNQKQDWSIHKLEG